MIESLITTLTQEFNLTADEIADICWLTLIRQKFVTSSATSQMTNSPIISDNRNLENDAVDTTGQLNNNLEASNTQQLNNNLEASANVPQAGLFNRESQSNSSSGTELKTFPFKVPNLASIRNPLDLARSLRPLIQRIPSKYDTTLDENKTAQKIAEERIWQAVTQPVLEPWLDLALVVDESTSMLMWQKTVLELQKLLRNYGAFRDVRTWGLLTDGEGKVGIRPGFGTMLTNQLRSPQELIDPSGRRLILLITDCVGSIWQTGKVLPTLKLWADENPIAILQMLPEWLWVRTALKQAAMAHFYAATPGIPNQQLSLIRRLTIEDTAANAQKTEVKVPVFSLEPGMIFTWGQMVTGKGNVTVPGYIFRLYYQPPTISSKSIDSASPNYTPEQQLQRFRVASSPMARRLAALLAASPTISLPVIRLIQETLLPKSRQVNVAEVLLGGILKPKETPQIGQKPDEVQYHFLEPKIRSLLLESAPVPDTVRVLTNYIEKKFQKSLDDFIADLKIWIQSEDEAIVERSRPFATVTAEVLKRKGGRYSQFVQEIESKFGSVGLTPSIEVIKTQSIDFIDFPFHDFSFEVATITIKNEPPFNLRTFEFPVPTIIIENEPVINLQPFEFQVATIEPKQTGGFLGLGQKTEVKRRRRQSQYFIEDLGNRVQIEMVEIPGGQFMMGAPKTEKDSSSDERPQHQVTVPTFFMGKYPITQAQWQAVAAMPQINRELDPNPSNFKGANRPVEKVSWYDAVEFCARLSQHTGKSYSLPSEAQWEYACRAGTTTPFHFGETITSELANYRATETYGAGKKGRYREQTTEVGSLKAANNFGLYDMHGNVWEWCLDDWHRNYEGAPTDGSAWFSSDENLIDRTGQAVIRGGSWIDDPASCRSAYRDFNFRDNRSYGLIGFRIVCAVGRTFR
jgi:formylglycine-generating enzyme required for sulfatase activity